VAESLAVAPLHHDVTPTPQDTGTLYLASCFPPANFVHSQIPVSERCLDNATRVNHGEGPSSGSVPIPFQPEYDPYYFNSQPMDSNILSTGMTNNPCQSYVRYANSDQSCDFIPSPPSSSTGSLSMPVEYSEEWYQQLEWLGLNGLNTHRSQAIPQPESILSNHDADNSYNDIMMAYAEYIGTAPITLILIITDRLS
jgi:hypothetical protein